MATIDSSLVRKELMVIRDSRKAVAAALRRTFEALEADPGQFPELDFVAPNIHETFADVTLRKSSIVSHRHNYRLIFAHWRLPDGEDHVDILYAFSRKAGYEIDWEWVAHILDKGT